MIGLIDIGIGNTQSLFFLIKKMGFDCIKCKKEEDLNNIDKIILPGVGAFGQFINELRKNNLFESIEKRVNNGIPILGICVGFEVLFTDCDEFGFHNGFNFIKGNVRKLHTSKKYKLPHVGWNNLKIKNKKNLFKDLDNNNDFYFCHSYVVKNVEENNILSLTDYSIEFISSVSKNNIFGVQFHPEKSQENGKKIIKNFLNNI
jgi:glutamine amidotransferase